MSGMTPQVRDLSKKRHGQRLIFCHPLMSEQIIARASMPLLRRALSADETVPIAMPTKGPVNANAATNI